MSRNSIKEINEMLKYGFTPDTLNYTLQDKTDWNKLRYTYNEFDDVCKRFTNGWQSIPGFDLVIQEIADNSVSPLDEMNERLEISNLLKSQ
jgi:hypothetical protein